VLATCADTAVTICSPLKTATGFRHRVRPAGEQMLAWNSLRSCTSRQRKGTTATETHTPILCSRRKSRKASAGTLCACELLARNGFKHLWIQGPAHGQVLPNIQAGEAHANCGFHTAEGLLGKNQDRHRHTDKFDTGNSCSRE
jgi:hypothetical protein